MTDIKLIVTPEGGEINIVEDFIVTEQSDTAAVLAISGGNDDGSDWWGNDADLSVKSSALQQYKKLPVTSATLKRISKLIESDLKGIDADISSLSYSAGRLDCKISITESLSVNINLEK